MAAVLAIARRLGRGLIVKLVLCNFPWVNEEKVALAYRIYPVD
jgi:hypothetical protein